MNNLIGNYRDNEQNEAREALDQVFQISNFLKCSIDKNTLAIMISLVENGVKPEQVAAIVA
jgi:mitotic-spindle organizing protein 1